jgi:peroxiredoxin
MAKKIKTNQIAPDFTLNDFNGRPVRLSSYRGKKIVLLVFNRGFV